MGEQLSQRERVAFGGGLAVDDLPQRARRGPDVLLAVERRLAMPLHVDGVDTPERLPPVALEQLVEAAVARDHQRHGRRDRLPARKAKALVQREHHADA
jgi:hypothetical protein